MLIVGAGGHATEVYDIVSDTIPEAEIFYFDNINDVSKRPDRDRILTSMEAAGQYLDAHGSQFVLGLGSPKHRMTLMRSFEAIGGTAGNVIAGSSIISKYVNHLGAGLNIMHQTFISSNVTIGDGALINCQVAIHHDCSIGEFTEIAPGVKLLGNCKIGSRTFVGSGASILPNVVVGDNCIIGANSMVNSDIPDNSVAYGSPARVVRSVEQ